MTFAKSWFSARTQSKDTDTYFGAGAQPLLVALGPKAESYVVYRSSDSTLRSDLKRGFPGMPGTTGYKRCSYTVSLLLPLRL